MSKIKPIVYNLGHGDITREIPTSFLKIAYIKDPSKFKIGDIIKEEDTELPVFITFETIESVDMIIKHLNECKKILIKENKKNELSNL